MTAITNYDPEIYDAFRPGPGGFQGDVDWYRTKAAAIGGSVLELGAGTGRVTLPIAEAGVQIAALDIDDGMLGKLREKLAALPGDARARVSVHHGDMRSFALDETFALVIIPFRAFLHNLTEDDQLACLKCAYEHLHPNGELAFNVFHPSLEFMAAHAGWHQGTWRWSGTSDLPKGRFLRRCKSLRYGSPTRTFPDSRGGVRRRRHARPDAHAATRAGVPLPGRYQADSRPVWLELTRISGDFTGRPFERDADELIIEARKR